MFVYLLVCLFSFLSFFFPAIFFKITFFLKHKNTEAVEIFKKVHKIVIADPNSSKQDKLKVTTDMVNAIKLVEDTNHNGTTA